MRLLLVLEALGLLLKRHRPTALIQVLEILNLLAAAVVVSKVAPALQVAPVVVAEVISRAALVPQGKEMLAVTVQPAPRAAVAAVLVVQVERHLLAQDWLVQYLALALPTRLAALAEPPMAATELLELQTLAMVRLALNKAPVLLAQTVAQASSSSATSAINEALAEQ
jgi:hypothetical protein